MSLCDWSSDVCSSDLHCGCLPMLLSGLSQPMKPILNDEHEKIKPNHKPFSTKHAVRFDGPKDRLGRALSFC